MMQDMTPTGPAPKLTRPKLPQPPRSLRADLTLALMPTLTVLVVFALVDAWSHRRLLFASLAASAFLVYLDPKHETNSSRTLVFAQGLAATVGFTAHALFGGSYWAAGGAMIVVIYGMIFAHAMHPPAVPTALSFALGAGSGRGLALFAVCVGLIVLLVYAQRMALRLLAHYPLHYPQPFQRHPLSPPEDAESHAKSQTEDTGEPNAAHEG